MLLLLFEVGASRFGIEASEIVEVIPLVSLKKVPHAPDCVSGVFNYRGQIVPVIDVNALLGDKPARPLLSTRIILVRPPEAVGEERLLGILAERATETLSCRKEELQPAGITVEGARYLGEILPHPAGLVQRVTVDNILSDELKSMLYEQRAGDAPSTVGEAS
ncbi:MAG: purine-binding chemotaxis protein CheW [Acidobacteria bacterium]|nr:MAG: purine-binding chemotaxis protein CheW [Acidobacteriota bacterium]